MPRPRLCVYCGSSHGRRPAYTDAARAVGEELAARGFDLVYGGGQVGLMGELADAALAAGAAVTGVITEHLMDEEVTHHDLTELIVVPDMPTRKREMFERSDGFLALPGGVGTMEEMFEVLCWWYLDLHPKPVGILNVDGFYDGLVSYFTRAAADGFIGRELLVVDDDPARLIAAVDALR